MNMFTNTISNRPNYRVMVIDDESSLTNVVKLNLELQGNHKVCVLNDSLRSEEVALEFKPDVVLLDINMPCADGGDVAMAFRDHPLLKDIPIIFVSAIVSFKESTGKLCKSGGELYLAKPVKAETLIKSIDDVLMERMAQSA